jgi:hypothetical protein
VVVFGVPQNNLQLAALTDEAIGAVQRVFNALGRFMPVEGPRLRAAMERAEGKGGTGEAFDKIARSLNADLYLIIGISQMGGNTFADFQAVPINPLYGKLRRQLRVKSRIMMNIPLKLGRETASLHDGLPVRARVKKDYGDGSFLINAGQWHGLARGSYLLADGRVIEVIQAGRFESAVRAGKGLKEGAAFAIPLPPGVGKIRCALTDSLAANAVDRYGLGSTLLRGSDPEKRLVEGICVVNMGGNVCLPGYGAFLSTHYLGFQNPEPGIMGIVLSSAAVIAQLTIPEIATGFKINFLPWKKDRDKTERMQNLQIFLWSTIPFTFSAAYMDQLAYQYAKNEVLPPFFYGPDAAAVVFSVVIPGGGLYYKGHRLAGWCFYFSEMMTAGYGVYRKDAGKKGTWAFAALGAIKAAEIVGAWMVKSSYRFYNQEVDGETEGASLSMGMGRIEEESVYRLGVTLGF